MFESVASNVENFEGDVPDPAPVTMAVLPASDRAMELRARLETVNWRGAKSPKRNSPCFMRSFHRGRATENWRWKRGES